MSTYLFSIHDCLVEMNIECMSASEAVSHILKAMSASVSSRSALPGDISITVMHADRSEIAQISVTFAQATGLNVQLM